MNLKPVNRMTCIETRPWLDWTTWQTPRWLTAIARTSLSQPARLAVEAGVITTATTVMDSGCYSSSLDPPACSASQEWGGNAHVLVCTGT